MTALARVRRIRRRRPYTKTPIIVTDETLSVPRVVTCRLLNLSLSSVLLLEERGKLTKVRPTGPTGKVLHRMSEIKKLAEGDE